MQLTITLIFLAFAAVAAATAVSDSSESVLGGLMTKQCYDIYFLQHDFVNIACFQKLISKALGIAIIAGAFGLKIPQIMVILKNKSVSGLAPSAFYLDVLAFLVTCCYSFLKGYPLTSWGESLVILIQNLFLVLLLWIYSTPKTEVSLMIVYAVIFGAFASAFLNIREEFQPYMVWGALACSVAGRIPQALANFSQGHTGVLAFAGFFLSFAGSLARVFTTIQETGDQNLIISFSISACTNLVIILQILYYRKATKLVLARAEAEKVKKQK